MHTIKLFTLSCRVHHSRHVLGIYLRLLWTWFLENISTQENKEKKTEPTSSFKGFNMYTRNPRNSWKGVRLNTNLAMTSTKLIISFKWEIKCGSISTRIG
jgi:hypothetical protein